MHRKKHSCRKHTIATLAASLVKLASNVTKTRNQIMSKISEFAAAQKQYNQEIGAGIDDGIVSDLAALNLKIETAVNNPEDHALLDGLLTDGQALAARVKTVDEMYPPTVPNP